MKIKSLYTSPLFQFISFSFLLIGNDKVIFPLIFWLIANSSSNEYAFNFSLYGFICLMLPISISIFNFKLKNNIQIITAYLMLAFLFSDLPKSFILKYIMRLNLSNIDLFFVGASFLFFLSVNISVIIKLSIFYFRKTKVFALKGND